MKKIFFILLLVTCTNCMVAGQNYDSLMRSHGLQDVLSYDSSLLIDLKYATTDNFVGRDMYCGLKTAYVQDEIGRMMAKAHKLVQAENPRWRILILDAARPMSVQKTMHDVVAGTPLHIYVANPAKGGGRHNYGVAVDCTIVEINDDGSYRWLDMGSGYDDFREHSHLDAASKGLLNQEQTEKRNILINTMKSVGFTMIKTEWWHFQKYSMDELPAIYQRLDF